MRVEAMTTLINLFKNRVGLAALRGGHTTIKLTLYPFDYIPPCRYLFTYRVTLASSKTPSSGADGFLQRYRIQHWGAHIHAVNTLINLTTIRAEAFPV